MSTGKQRGKENFFFPGEQLVLDQTQAEQARHNLFDTAGLPPTDVIEPDTQVTPHQANTPTGKRARKLAEQRAAGQS